MCSNATTPTLTKAAGTNWEARKAHRSPNKKSRHDCSFANGYDLYSFTEFSLDATTFEHRGRRYFIWAEKVHRRFGISNLYIAEMASPTN